MPAAPRYAVLICTRNRPDDLARTLASLDDQRMPGPLALFVVDGSSPDVRRRNRSAVHATRVPSRYLPFCDRPSLPRQRNRGLDALPPSVEIVFFLDDDVTLHDGYLCTIAALFDRRPAVGGVGGRQVPPPPERASSVLRRMARYIFLLDHPAPGRLLPSGHISGYHRVSTSTPFEVEWLCGFSCAFRRSLLQMERFDPDLDGYALFEDRDVSIRMAQRTTLMVHPEATLTHHVSPINRYDVARFHHTAVVNRHWLVRKHRQAGLSRSAWAWSLFGQWMALRMSTRDAAPAQQGFWAGLREVIAAYATPA